MRIAGYQPRTRPERLFQVPAGRTKSSGQVATGDVRTRETVTLGDGREVQPLKSLSGETLLSLASQSALKAAAGTSLPASVTNAFAPAEFLMLNSGDYHGAQHPIKVGQTVKTLARNSGRTEQRAEFLNQVALVHDADERIMLNGNGNYSFKEGAAPARVPVTLAWMDVNQGGLQERFGWNKGEFQEAKALIAGTEHPLNDTVGPKTKNNLPDYDGKSAQNVLAEQLQAVPADRRTTITEEVQLLRFADQSAEYLQGEKSAKESVSGLSREIGVPEDALLAGTPSFVGGLGKDNEAFGDLPRKVLQTLTSDLDIEAPIYTSEQLHGFLSDSQNQALGRIRSGWS